MFYPIPRALLFRLDPEHAHELTLRAITQVGRIPPLRHALAKQIYSARDLEPVEVFGLRFANRVGLARATTKTRWAGADLPPSVLATSRSAP